MQSRDEMEGIADESSEQLNSPNSSYLNGLYGEPEVLPRVGDEYQADIPNLIPEDDRLKLINGSKSQSYPHNPFSLGLPIPIMWTRSEKFKGFRETNGNYFQYDDPFAKSDPAANGKVRTIVLALPCQRNVKFKFEWLNKSLNLFPGTLGESWEDAEQKKFLLGLYFLGKNLAFVQRFVGSKSMGDVLSYYYGGFYRSDEYKKWTEGRSLRSRRSVQGHKLLTGWRQQELLSRISSHLPEESKITLLEVSKAFREEKIGMEEYVLALKDKVGSDILIEAIGIGKGKKDLTNGAIEPAKTNLATSGNSEVPIGKACSSLSPDDIVRYLTGGIRMSKARSSDLFWEAVWPRLLARGWHSEQPRDDVRNSLVFLIPGTKKFSRRKMVKGNHYFDSVTDVLNKVASDPTLLELEAEAEAEAMNRDDENGNEQLINSDEFDDCSPNSKRHKYLQPRRTNNNDDIMMFTIVDTSTIHGSERRMLRCLPVETSDSSSESWSENEAERKVKGTSMTACVDEAKHSYLNMSVDNVGSQSCVSFSENQMKKRKVKAKGLKGLSSCGKRSSLDCTETTSEKKKARDVNTHQEDHHHHHNHHAHKLSSASSCAEEDSFSVRTTEVERFDLNISQVSAEREAESTVAAESFCGDQSSVQTNTELPSTDQHCGRRRQSTRSRPLTTKALEAFAFGFLGSPRKKRKDGDESRFRSRSKSSKRTVVTAEFRNGTVNDDPNTVENG